MTKTQRQEITRAGYYCTMGHADIAARSLSALIRSATSNKAAAEIRAEAERLGVAGHPEFIA